MTKIDGLDISGNAGGGSVPEGVNLCKIIAAEYGIKEWPSGDKYNCLTLEVETGGISIRFVNFNEVPQYKKNPNFKIERVFKSTVPKPKEADTKLLIGGEIRLLLYKNEKGYMSAHDMANPGTTEEDKFAYSVSKGYTKVHENSIFASLSSNGSPKETVIEKKDDTPEVGSKKDNPPW